MIKFALVNQKGGCNKTTSAVNIATCLAKKKKKVLLIDIDPQAHATIYLGINPYTLKQSIYEVLIKSAEIKDTIVPTNIKGLEVLPSHINLSGAEIELVNHFGRENVLRDKLKTIENNYDYILIDCPPSLGLLTINALNAVDQLIVPIQAEFFALEGAGKLINTVELVRERLNPNLSIFKVLITRYDGRKNICKDVAQNIQTYFKDKVFKTIIRENVKLAESPSYGQPIILYAPKSIGSKDYINLTEEILKHAKNK